jgi:hypothetical protein
MGFRDLIDSIIRKPTEGYTSFSVGRPLAAGEPERFVAYETYVEIRLSQMFLRDERVLWREFIPLGSILTEILFADRRQTVPFLVGPDLLAQAPSKDQGDLVEFFGRRVAGPFPYQGDDVVVYAGLARLESDNWARRVLSCLGTVATAFDVSRLTSYVDVGGALTDALQGLLRMQEVEHRIGVDRSYATPPDPGIEVPQGALRPSFEVFVNAPSSEFKEERQRGFEMRDGRLHEGDREFREADFMVLEIVPSDSRPDYTSFDFHRVHWREAEKHVMEGREDDAWDRFTLLASDLAANDDLAQKQRDALLEEYGDRLRASIERRKRAFSRGGRQEFRPADLRLSLGESDLREAARRGANRPLRTPEELFASRARPMVP